LPSGNPRRQAPSEPHPAGRRFLRLLLLGNWTSLNEEDRYEEEEKRRGRKQIFAEREKRRDDDECGSKTVKRRRREITIWQTFELVKSIFSLSSIRVTHSTPQARAKMA